MIRTLGTVAVAVLLFPVVAFAQQGGAIAGVVRDTTGAVLPGVTVEASSPALIEKVRVVTTDEAGLYRIVDLRPGVYSISFTLAGFTTLKREGIELTVGFTATVNVELRVGTLAETITVSGATPLVDVQNVNVQQVMTRDVMEGIPNGKQYTGLAQLIPGMYTSAPGGPINQDVGGMTGMTMTNMQVHGGAEPDGAVRVNGMTVASITSQGNSRTNIQDGDVEEYQMQLAALAAEFPYGGVYMNVIPKQGGNGYRGALFAGGTNTNLQSNNLGNLKAEGLTAPNLVQKIIDVNPSLGGAIVQDRVWFYTAYRYFVTNDYVAGLYANSNPGAGVYVPNLGQQAINDQNGKNGSLNLTWQASQKNRFTLYYNYDFQCYCHYGINALLAPEAANHMTSRAQLIQGTWTEPVTNRLLLQAGVSHYYEVLPRDPEEPAIYPGITEQSTGITFRGRGTNQRNDGLLDHYRASASYVTAKHALKVGFELEHQLALDTEHVPPANETFRTLNGIPNLVTYYASPYQWSSTMIPWAIYAQDQWTLHRFTVNAGLRYDRFQSSYPAETVAPSEFLPVVRSYPGANVLNWKDSDPRLGVSWDVFGDGKTAVKASLSRYVQQEGKTNTNALNPVIAATNSISRTWTPSSPADYANGVMTVVGNPLNPAANGDLGASPNNNFGKPISTLQFNPAWADGYGTRPFDWETTAGVQQSITPRLSVGATYIRRIYGNFVVNDNILVTPSDYNPYSITTPVDPRLPGGGGQVISGLYDLNPAYVGLVDNVRTDSQQFGNQYKHYNGVDITLNARLSHGVVIQGGGSVGQSWSDDCNIVTQIDSQGGSSGANGSGTVGGIGTLQGPSTYNCHEETPWLWQWKFLANYPLPWWGLQVSGTYQQSPYDPTGTFTASALGVYGMRAYYVATNAQIAPSLGRNLSGGAPNATIDLIPENPGLYFAPLREVDFRLAKKFVMGRVKLQGLFDAFNLFNNNTPLTFNTTYGTNGANWLKPTNDLPGRLIKFGLQASF